MRVLHALGHALSVAGSMTWLILWTLVFGFALAAGIQAVVRRETVVARLGNDRPGTLALAAAFGAASSSCSYAAVALARSLVRKGADFTAAMVVEIASTNLIVELGVIMAVLMGWQFTLGEFVGGPIMIVLVALAFRHLVRRPLVDEARRQAERGLPGRMEGHAAMDMTVGGEGSALRRFLTPQGFTSLSHVFAMEWAAVVGDLAIGLLATGAIAAWVPVGFWRDLSAVHHPLVADFVGPLLGPLLSVLSFVCSVGNVPLAAVLWNGGLSFGGVVSFIFADLIILPVLSMYKKYYGTKMMMVLAAIFYGAMVLTGYVVQAIFGATGLVPATRAAHVGQLGVHWDYTTVLNIAALLLATVLVVRFIRTDGVPMLKMMGAEHDEVAQGGSCHAKPTVP